MSNFILKENQNFDSGPVNPLLLVPSLTNKRLPSELLLHNTRNALCAFLLYLFSGTLATMLVTILVPLTTDCLKVLRFFYDFNWRDVFV